MADRWSSPMQDGSQEQHLCSLRPEGNLMVLRCYFHKEKGFRPEAISRCRAWCSFLVGVSEHFANLVDGDYSPWIWTEPFSNIFAIECFRGAYESFIQGLHFVAAVRWEANYEKPGRFVAAHFLVPHSLNSCLHPFGVPFFPSSRLWWYITQKE